MMSKKRAFGLTTIATVMLGVGAALYVAPGIAVSNPTQTTSAKGNFSDPAPQRMEVAQAQTGGAAGSTLPGGASSLNETYKDWRVACQVANNTKRCVMSQQQAQQNGQRVLAIELNAPSGNVVTGTLVLPFGLALDSGVTFQIDEKPAMPPIRFRTCVPGGCLVNVNFDAPTLVALRASAILKIKATADGGAAAPFSISLQGFGTALDRVVALAR
ncbi:invasion associated locus B family protein [Brucella intermedia]|uniref:invasion associated locus B family protein n=1 Tax=Brucella intermedia TaxID=94625 RepID=UPI00244D3ECF|nr:invasion associated locus B family protein [Brucella intermedia]WGG59396.1 invasion associated locus B family protein [Brucella intermedia]